MEAVSVHYEIISEEDKLTSKAKSSPQRKNVDVTDQDELHRIFQDLSSSDSENDKEDLSMDGYAELKVEKNLQLYFNNAN